MLTYFSLSPPRTPPKPVPPPYLSSRVNGERICSVHVCVCVCVFGPDRSKHGYAGQCITPRLEVNRDRVRDSRRDYRRRWLVCQTDPEQKLAFGEGTEETDARRGEDGRTLATDYDDKYSLICGARFDDPDTKQRTKTSKLQITFAN